MPEKILRGRFPGGIKSDNGRKRRMIVNYGLNQQYSYDSEADLNLRTYAERWLLIYARLNLKPATVRAYTENLRNHILPYLGMLPLTSIKTTDGHRSVI
jgi:hypothetical protein